jgi:O-antigen ligase
LALFGQETFCQNLLVRILGFSGLLIFAVGLSMGKSLQIFGLALMLLGLIADYRRFFPKLKYCYPIYMIGFFLFYIWIRSLYGVFFEAGIDSSELINGARKYSYIMMYPIIGWWLRGDEKLISRFFAIIIATTVAYILLCSGINPFEFYSGRPSERNFPTLLLAYAILCALLLVWIYSFFLKVATNNNVKKIKKLVLGICMVFSFVVIFLTLMLIQTRSTTTSLVLVMILLFPVIIFNIVEKTNSSITKRKMLAIIGCCLIFLGLVVSLSLGTLKDRYNHETETFRHILQHKSIDQIPRTSFGKRVHMWLAGWNYIKEKPVIGHGFGMNHKITQDGTIVSHSHFHNTFIESLVAWGVLGSALLFGVFIVMGIQVFQVWRKGRISFEMLMFLLGGFLVVFASGLTHSLGVRQTTWTYTGLWAGVAFSYCYNWFRSE